MSKMMIPNQQQRDFTSQACSFRRNFISFWNENKPPSSSDYNNNNKENATSDQKQTSTTTAPSEETGKTSTSSSSWIGGISGVLSTVKDTVSSTTETVMNANVIQYINDLIHYLKNINITKLESDAKEKALTTLQDATKHQEQVKTNESAKTEQDENEQKLLLSFKDVFQNNDHPLHHMNIEKSGLSKVLNLIPFFSYVELMFKYVVYQTMNLVFEAVVYGNFLSKEQKQQVVNEFSSIVIKNSLDPMAMAIELVEYSSQKLGADENVSKQLAYVTSLLPYMKKVALFVKKFK
ncbi:hypothetical protein C9374_001881 [Naegleria lovaniensis]|uniref:Uncharacterized protein n=1 Tax=Naegleria lovaniensis TaxID=51637 RepID=A0AA88KMT3_NAELO|nr:uncharacterized protein C9374_001881 [Naegleria lovaniensis]KAG2386846.1 hypothetical protein C9374_001881 [Naegleria lovaniensis]